MNLTDSQYRSVVAHAQRTAAAIIREQYGDLPKRVQSLEEQVRNLQARPTLYTGVKPICATIREGDRWLNGDEVFTFFRGEWRRRSQLEAYASAAQYL